MCICTVRLQVADALGSSRYPVHHFISIQSVLSWPGGIPFENGLVSLVYMCFVRLESEIVPDENRLVKFHNMKCSHVRWSAQRPFKDWPRKSYPRNRNWQRLNCWNFSWLKKMYPFRFLGKEKTEERSVCVRDCIDSDTDWFTAKGIL